MNDQRGDGARPAHYTTITRSGAQSVEGEVIHEQLVTVYVNGQELMTAMCSPIQQEALALGFLANEGVIERLDEVADVRVCGAGTCVDVWLAHSNYTPPRRMILTSGCGGGVTFDDLRAEYPPLKSERQIAPEKLWELMDALQQSAHLYRRARGVHTSALSDGESLLLLAEDVGRHNTLDKLRGLALQQGVETRDCLILSTGRVSSEMINKARRMSVPMICSRTSPTSLSVGLAEDWNITLVGYLRRNSMNVYTHPQRIVDFRRISPSPQPAKGRQVGESVRG